MQFLFLDEYLEYNFQLLLLPVYSKFDDECSCFASQGPPPDRRGGNWRERELGGSSGGAAHLARIHGTEEDRVNCPFYFKIGACRHGERCSRQHHKPPFSQTMLVKHMWVNPSAAVAAAGGDLAAMDQKVLQDEFDDFYEEIYEEMSKFGKLEEVIRTI